MIKLVVETSEMKVVSGGQNENWKPGDPWCDGQVHEETSGEKRDDFI